MKVAAAVTALVLASGSLSHAESLFTPIAIYGGANTADLLSTRYLQAHGGFELNPVGADLTGQVALKLAATTGEVFIDQKVLASHKTARWVVRGVFVLGYGYVTYHNLKLAHH